MSNNVWRERKVLWSYVVAFDAWVGFKKTHLYCREWVLDSQIRYIKVVTGPVGMESILVGLRSGQIFRIFVNNPFPNLLLMQKVAIRCLDLSQRYFFKNQHLKDDVSDNMYTIYQPHKACSC